ncbi:cupin domain-containing protein [Crenothrix sp.]|uniref:cupin domain-containing protein n=1 Tax=Crenothrix sp. TaxID=3100433 RepID=UPI00374CA9BE
MNSHLKNKFSPDDSEQSELNRLLLAEIKPFEPSQINQQAIEARLKARVAQSVANHAALLTVRAKKGVWQTLKTGIRFKPLWSGTCGNSVLVEFSAGATLPVHRHNWLEEGVVLRGDLHMGDLQLKQFDYHVSPPGSRHACIGSRQGALAYLRGTSIGDKSATLREIIGGLLPVQRGVATTVYNDDEGWQELQPGVFRKQLLTDGISASYFYRLEAGASCAGHLHSQNEECMMLSGEIFLGDVLLRENDYQFAPKGSEHDVAYTDVGALLYLRGAAA